MASLASAVFITNLPFTKLAGLMPAPLAILLSIAWHFRKPTDRLNAAAARVGVEIAVAREGMELIATLTPHATKLRDIRRRLAEGNAASTLLRLERLTNAIAECDKPYFDLPSRAMIVRTQLCFAIEAWKHRHARHLTDWLDAWAEFEALSALAGYAHEHPADPFPVFEEGDAAFAARGLGHPLIPVSTCVRNDVAPGAGNRFYVVSGSNMAGKSTLLRSVGLNTILAKAGAPVRAHALCLTHVELFASLSLVDSLAEGRSKFLAEVERTRRDVGSGAGFRGAVPDRRDSEWHQLAGSTGRVGIDYQGADGERGYWFGVDARSGFD